MSFTCPKCLATSYHPKDEEHGYCGRCHEFTAPHCSTCGKRLSGVVPEGATNITCFACDNQNGAGDDGLSKDRNSTD